MDFARFGVPMRVADSTTILDRRWLAKADISGLINEEDHLPKIPRRPHESRSTVDQTGCGSPSSRV